MIIVNSEPPSSHGADDVINTAYAASKYSIKYLVYCLRTKNFLFFIYKKLVIKQRIL